MHPAPQPNNRPSHPDIETARNQRFSLLASARPSISLPTAMNNSQQLEFPVLCHFKVIAEDCQGMGFVIETVLLELGVQSPVERGNASSRGKYVTYNIDIRVESPEQMRRIDEELRRIQGVRMVL